jgi:thiol-disulfide isomerase/thioredoxin
MAAHGCGLLAGVFILANLSAEEPASRHPTSPSGSVPFSAARKTGLVLVGFGAVVLLAVGQWLHQPRTFAVDSAGKLATRKAPRLLQLHGGILQLDLSDVPLLGSPEAPCVIVHLFDYSCPHCRQLHPMLKRVHEQLGNQVAIASLLVPLATNCNRVVKRVLPMHTNACDYAYAGLALWRVRPELLPAFEDWIFTPERPPTPEAVHARAMQWVGTNEFLKALKDPWIPAHIDRNATLYATNYYRFRKSVLPELIIGTNIISGVVRSPEDIYRLVTNQFDLKIAGHRP